jgi:type I restriction enzyme R subunit
MDLQNTLTDISTEIAKLPQAYSDLLNLFKTLKNKNNIDEYIHYLSDIALREEFYAKFNLFTKILKMALSTLTFYDNTPAERIDLYKNDFYAFDNVDLPATKITNSNSQVLMTLGVRF